MLIYKKMQSSFVCGQLAYYVRYAEGVMPVHFLKALTNALGSEYPIIAAISLTDEELFSI